jgi:[ribosomal protein S5]-alanine N-acetyltransferase
MNALINASRLNMICCSVELLEKIIEGNDALSNFLNVTVPERWGEFGMDPFRYSLEKIKAHANETEWWTYLSILKEENTLIGNGGFKGPPDQNGMVEIGYEIAINYRNRGFATEMAQALIQFAFQHAEVKLVQAHTLAEENASTGVLRKCGMKWMGEVNDPNDGLVWRWEIKK